LYACENIDKYGLPIMINNKENSQNDIFKYTVLKFSFLVDLVGLLRWRQHKYKIPEVLDSLGRVRGDEIMKVSIVFYLQ
jgi:hypothetical protein